MKLYCTKFSEGVNSLSIFHAAAELGIECVIITSPASTFVSTGYFDNAASVLNRDKLLADGIPVFRRKIGGGVVLLDPDQVFYQIVLDRNSPILPRMIKNAYVKFSKAPIKAFAQLGVQVEYRPINDLVVTASKLKISGQGAGIVEKSFVFAGNMLIDFNCELMADILNVPDKKKASLVKMLKSNLTSLTKELGRKPDKEEVESVLAEKFKSEYPQLEESSPPDTLLQRASQLSVQMTSDVFVYEESGRSHDQIKIREGVYFDRT
ncbi:MAG: biotin/lipoate A/B protein ligase family protein [Candidatus Desulfatibia sp.]|uniref:lipoate--protein ligase family protein n=1 Tax=Candidatus Desulfatibia sp. TaxID=3101189 RepID=UPI002F2F03A2